MSNKNGCLPVNNKWKTFEKKERDVETVKKHKKYSEVLQSLL